ncbi:DUF6677 family protein [Cohnella sp. WQ 127256]|uniref:DUF6677 family protein n=1 Tax=Cohnella sp. WQ 127256 TaxID=2938790 RepID=UPI002119105E|nr:DUF6677 family protein [Cohnella sp. WQ 127256]
MMKGSGDWSNGSEYPLPPSPDLGEGVQQQEQWTGYGVPPGNPMGGHVRVSKRRKWIAGFLAFLIPGIGHMYLGLMVKGIVLMILLALNITAIVYVSMDADNVLSVVLLSLLIPIIYFYNLFDAIQSTDVVNDRAAATGMHRGWMNETPKPSIEERLTRSAPPIGILLLAGAGIVIILLSGTHWTNWLFDSFGSMFGAVVLVGAGVGLWFWESRGHGSKRN